MNSETSPELIEARQVLESLAKKLQNSQDLTAKQLAPILLAASASTRSGSTQDLMHVVIAFAKQDLDRMQNAKNNRN